MHIPALATLNDDTRIRGYLTTNHPASHDGWPVFTNLDDLLFPWEWITDITTTAAQAAAGRARAGKPNAQRASRRNGRKSGGRPRKTEGFP